MKSNNPQKRSLTRIDKFRFFSVIPVISIIFLAVLLTASSIERHFWGISVSWFDHYLFYSFSIATGIFAGWVAAPARFRKLSACIISVLILVCVTGQYVWNAIYGAGSFQDYGGLMVAATGIYFILPHILAVETEQYDEVRKKIEWTKTATTILLIVAVVMIALLTGIALMAHFLPEFKIIFIGMMCLNIIIPTWHWIVDRKITGISAFVFFFGAFWKQSPLGILFAVAVGGIAALSGYPSLAPYAAIAGFLTYEGVALFRSAKNRSTQNQ
jgi:hypothetical protein